MLSLAAPAFTPLNVKAYVQGALAARVAVQVVFAGSAVRSGPLLRQDRSVNAAVATTVTVTGRAWLSNAVAANGAMVAVNVPLAVTTPLRETVIPVATVRTPLAPPVLSAAGKKPTVMVQVPLVATVVHVVLWRRNPSPATCGLTATGTPVLVTTTVFVAEEPWSTEPKLTVA